MCNDLTSDINATQISFQFFFNLYDNFIEINNSLSRIVIY